MFLSTVFINYIVFSDLELRFFMGFFDDELIVCFILLQFTPSDRCSFGN